MLQTWIKFSLKKIKAVLRDSFSWSWLSVVGIRYPGCLTGQPFNLNQPGIPVDF
jgi:hypothetical protein